MGKHDDSTKLVSYITSMLKVNIFNIWRTLCEEVLDMNCLACFHMSVSWQTFTCFFLQHLCLLSLCFQQHNCLLTARDPACQLYA